MGRLFWKFFLCILLAQIAATVAIGGAVWLKNRNQEANNPTADLDTSPPAEMAINSAAATLEYGGPKALRNLLENMDMHRVYAVDDKNHEMLGRIVTKAMLGEAHYLLRQGGTTAANQNGGQGSGQRRVVRQVTDTEGKRYLLFIPSSERYPGMNGDNNPIIATLRGRTIDPLGIQSLQGQRGPDNGPQGNGGAGDFRPGPGYGQPGGPPQQRGAQPARTGNAAASATYDSVSGPASAQVAAAPAIAPVSSATDSSASGATASTASAATQQPAGPPGGPGGMERFGQPDNRDFPDRRRGFNPRFQPMTPWVPIVTAVAASLLFAFLLAWYFSRPIRELRQAFEAAAGGDLSPRFAHITGSSNELHDLGRDFDQMTERLRNLIEGQTRLLHDVSHELRSPLARLQAAIGLAHQRPDKLSTSLERIERESVRMDKLVGELLTLSRLEAGATMAMADEIPMGELLVEIADDAEFEAASCGRHVVLEGEAEVMVIGHTDLLARAIENVVRNAVKHSPEGGTVQLQTVRMARQLEIRVLDRGPGVPPADLDTIFQPFFRSTNASTEGHGLGLAIAQHVVQAHGGSIKASNRLDGGLCVEITLPVAQDKV